MSATWQVRIHNAAGTLQAILDHFQALEIERAVNAPGGYSLTMAATATLVSYFVLDGQLEFWRRDAAFARDWTLEFEAFHRDLIRWYGADGLERITSRGVGYADLLRRRVIEAAGGSAGAVKTGKAETILKAYVDEQCVNNGTPARNFTGLTIQADGATGNTITMGSAYQNLLATCQEIARIGGGDFAVVGTGAATFQARWYNGQFGTDRSATVTFAVNMGNATEPELSQVRSQEVNAVLVGGQGEGTARATVWRTTASLIDDSTWNRMELFSDGRNLSTTAGLNSQGDGKLDEGQPRNDFSLKVIQLPGCAYGVHYGLGDLVTARYGTYSGTKKIKAVGFNVADGVETLGIELLDV